MLFDIWYLRFAISDFPIVIGHLSFVIFSVAYGPGGPSMTNDKWRIMENDKWKMISFFAEADLSSL